MVSGLLQSPREAPVFLFSDDVLLEGQMGPSACVAISAPQRNTSSFPLTAERKQFILARHIE